VQCFFHVLTSDNVTSRSCRHVASSHSHISCAHRDADRTLVSNGMKEWLHTVKWRGMRKKQVSSIWRQHSSIQLAMVRKSIEILGQVGLCHG